MPKVSVIIPTFNRAEMLRLAIASVLNQTFQDFEIIVVDDASKDNTQEVIDRFHDARIKHLHHKKNKGEAGARNTGILNSTGEFIAFLDDDDEWLPEKLLLQVSLLGSNAKKIGLVYTGYLVIDRNSQDVLSQRVPSKKGDVYNYMICENIIGAPSTVLLRRECVEQVGLFDKDIAYGLDYDMWIRISKNFLFEFIEKSLVKYYVHENRLSNNPEIMLRGFKDMMNKYGKDIVFKNRWFRDKFLWAGMSLCCNGNTRNGRESFIYAIKANPLEVRNYFGLGCTFLGTKNFRKIKSLKDKLLEPLREKRNTSSKK